MMEKAETSKRKPTQVWEVFFVKEGQRYFMKILDIEGAINIWKEQSSSMDVMVEGNRIASLAGMLHEREIPYTIAIKDVGSLMARELSPLGHRTKQPVEKRRMNWTSYHRLEVIYEFMENLEIQYPDLCEVIVIGRTVENRKIKLLKISNGNQDNVGVWIDGGIHAREWISPATVTYLADQIVKRFRKHPEYVTDKDWYILPVMNPDGYEYTFETDRMWRKNRRRIGEQVGVDLNRNFSQGWAKNGEEGSSNDPGSNFYRGHKPFSEPETQAVRKTILECGTQFKVFISFHSYGEVILFPWGYTDDPCPDYVELLQGGSAMSKAMQESTGHTYKVGSTKDLMYYSPGNSIDWSYSNAKIEYSYMVELRGKTHRFLLPKEEIFNTCEEATRGVFALLDFVDNECRHESSCISCNK